MWFDGHIILYIFTEYPKLHHSNTYDFFFWGVFYTSLRCYLQNRTLFKIFLIHILLQRYNNNAFLLHAFL